VQILLYSIFYYHAFLRPAPLPLPVSMASAFLAAMFLINWGFTAMHDASHFALGAKDHWLNRTMCRFWCALVSWNCQSWMHHHAVRHHAVTGGDDLDLDVQHALPLIRKSPAFERSRAHRWMVALGDSLPGMSGWVLGAIIFYTPRGLRGGQTMMYGFYRLNRYLSSPVVVNGGADTGQPWGRRAWARPSKQPSKEPSKAPLVAPTAQPSSKPTSQPTTPTAAPTTAQSTAPTAAPSEAPSAAPTAPTTAPTKPKPAYDAPDPHADRFAGERPQQYRALASMGFLGFFTLIFGSWRVAEYLGTAPTVSLDTDHKLFQGRGSDESLAAYSASSSVGVRPPPPACLRAPYAPRTFAPLSFRPYYS
jgi:hypothetical protein